MSVKNNKKKSVVSEALMDIEEMKKSIKEESNQTISTLLSEAVKNYLNESISEDEEDDDNEYSVEDEDTENTDAQDKDEEVSEDSDEESADSEDDAEESEDDSESLESSDDNEGEDDGWSEFDKYKVGDDTYDLTGEEDDDAIVKVYKLLKDDDQVVIKQNGDNLSLKDNETGAEYVIDCGGSCNESSEKDGAELNENDELEFELNDDEDLGDDASEDDFDFEGEPQDEFGEDDIDMEDDEFDDEDLSDEDSLDDEEFNNDEEESEFMEGKETMYEINMNGLGYTDNYQDKDPIQGLNVNEPSKSGKSWHKGIPTGTQKPWAGKGSSKPFGEKKALEEEDLLSEIPADEAEMTEGTNVTMPNRRHKSKSHSPQQKNNPKVAHHDSKNGEYKALEEKLERLQKENRELKAVIPQLKKGVNEAVLVNYKLGRIVKLFSENTTSKKEKIDIINRFDGNASSIKETKALYESIQRELKNSKPAKANLTLEGKSMTAKGSTINETTVYQSNDVKEALQLIKRMGM